MAWWTKTVIVPLAVGDGNVISVVVTAQDGETTTDTVTVTRAGSGDASLRALSLSGVTLSPLCLCVGDDGVHGVCGARGDGDDGDGVG